MITRAPLRIKQATEEDVPLILMFIRELAQHEKALERVTATQEGLRVTLFGPRPYAEAIIAYQDDEPIGFAIYFFSDTSFSALPGLYLEDIYLSRLLVDLVWAATYLHFSHKKLSSVTVLGCNGPF